MELTICNTYELCMMNWKYIVVSRYEAITGLVWYFN